MLQRSSQPGEVWLQPGNVFGSAARETVRKAQFLLLLGVLSNRQLNILMQQRNTVNLPVYIMQEIQVEHSGVCCIA